MAQKLFLSLLFLLSGAVDAVCAQETAEEKPAVAVSSCAINNWGVVAEGIFRGEKLNNEADYSCLSAMGVKTVVNLRYFHEDRQKLCAKHGLNCVSYPIKLITGLNFKYETLQKAFYFVLAERAAGRKVYFHCMHGSDRTGLLSAAIMIRDSACGKQFKADELWTTVDATLARHGFHGIYGNLRKTAQSWVYDFEKNPWLCRDTPDTK